MDDKLFPPIWISVIPMNFCMGFAAGLEPMLPGMGVPEPPNFSPAANVHTKRSGAFALWFGHALSMRGGCGARAANFSSRVKWVASSLAYDTALWI